MIFADVEYCFGSITVAEVKCGQELIKEKSGYVNLQVYPGWIYDNLTHAKSHLKGGSLHPENASLRSSCRVFS